MDLLKGVVEAPVAQDVVAGEGVSLSIAIARKARSALVVVIEAQRLSGKKKSRSSKKQLQKRMEPNSVRRGHRCPALGPSQRHSQHSQRSYNTKATVSYRCDTCGTKECEEGEACTRHSAPETACGAKPEAKQEAVQRVGGFLRKAERDAGPRRVQAA